MRIWPPSWPTKHLVDRFRVKPNRAYGLCCYMVPSLVQGTAHRQILKQGRQVNCGDKTRRRFR